MKSSILHRKRIRWSRTKMKAIPCVLSFFHPSCTLGISLQVQAESDDGDSQAPDLQANETLEPSPPPATDGADEDELGSGTETRPGARSARPRPRPGARSAKASPPRRSLRPVRPAARPSLGGRAERGAGRIGKGQRARRSESDEEPEFITPAITGKRVRGRVGEWEDDEADLVGRKARNARGAAADDADDFEPSAAARRAAAAARARRRRRGEVLSLSFSFCCVGVGSDSAAELGGERHR
jgi:hypothetical protein